MGACASRPSDDGASTSGSSKKSKAGKPRSDASTNPARVLNLGADAESYFARSGGRAFYASPPVSATDSVPRASLPRAAVEQAVTFESADGTHLAGVVHRPYDDDAGAWDPPEDRALEGARSSRNAKRPIGARRGADAFDDVRTVPSPSSRHAGTLEKSPRAGGNLGRGRNEIGRRRDGDGGRAPSTRGAGVALCHPHPFLGGDKDSALVVALARRLARAGVAVLRFDSRGVGGSGGTRTWMRDAEREDCEAATRFVSRLRGVDKKRVYAVGYGLGAAVALEASKRERSARGFVGISYPFGAKSMLVPCAVGEKAIRVRGNGGIGDAFPKKPRLFAVAGRDCVGSAGDCDAVAASVRKLPPPRRVVVVDDADHAWCGFYETLAEHVVEFMEEHAAALSAGSSSSESDEASDEPSADGGRPATGRDVASSSSISKSSSPDEFGARMSENEDTDDSGDGSPFGGSSFGGSRRARRDAASRGAPTPTAAPPLSDEARYAGGWVAETLTEVSDLRVEAPGWNHEARARARAAATAGGRPLGPLAGRGAREKPRAGDKPPPRVSSSSSPLRLRRRQNQNFPDAPSSDDGQSSVGAYGDASGGFETWEAWEEEKRRRAKMGSPGHTPAASRGSTPWQTPGHSPGRSPLGPRSVADFDELLPLDEPLDDRIVIDFAEPADPWALNGAPPLIRKPEDVAAKAAAKLAALRAEEFETKSDASGSLSDVSAPAASRASNRRVPTPMPVATVETRETIDGGSSKGRLSRTGSRDGLAAQFPPRNDSPRLEKGTPPLGSPSGSRPARPWGPRGNLRGPS
jgi:alpha/beta superfamily hydrolase